MSDAQKPDAPESIAFAPPGSLDVSRVLSIAYTKADSLEPTPGHGGCSIGGASPLTPGVRVAVMGRGAFVEWASCDGAQTYTMHRGAHLDLIVVIGGDIMINAIDDLGQRFSLVVGGCISGDSQQGDLYLKVR